MSITDKSAEADFFLWHFRGNINFLPRNKMRYFLLLFSNYFIIATHEQGGS